MSTTHSKLKLYSIASRRLTHLGASATVDLRLQLTTFSTPQHNNNKYWFNFTEYLFL